MDVLILVNGIRRMVVERERERKRIRNKFRSRTLKGIQSTQEFPHMYGMMSGRSECSCHHPWMVGDSPGRKASCRFQETDAKTPISDQNHSPNQTSHPVSHTIPPWSEVHSSERSKVEIQELEVLLARPERSFSRFIC